MSPRTSTNWHGVGVVHGNSVFFGSIFHDVSTNGMDTSRGLPSNGNTLSSANTACTTGSRSNTHHQPGLQAHLRTTNSYHSYSRTACTRPALQDNHRDSSVDVARCEVARRRGPRELQRAAVRDVVHPHELGGRYEIPQRVVILCDLVNVDLGLSGKRVMVQDAPRERFEGQPTTWQRRSPVTICLDTPALQGRRKISKCNGFVGRY
jgi:hypothetical protein